MSAFAIVKASADVLPVIMIYEHPSDPSQISVAVPGLDGAAQTMCLRIMAEAVEAAGACGFVFGNMYVLRDQVCTTGRITVRPDGKHTQLESGQRLLKELEAAARREATVRTARYPVETYSHDVRVL